MKITNEIHEFIIKSTNISNRKLVPIIKEKFGISVSYRQIGEYKKKPLISQKYPKEEKQLPKNIPKIKSESRPKMQYKKEKSRPIINPKKLIDITTVIDNMRLHGHKQNLDDVKNIVGSTEITSVRNWLKTEIKSLI